jgi:hypothetical protein
MDGIVLGGFVAILLQPLGVDMSLNSFVRMS